jgi:hypothetical protein
MVVIEEEHDSLLLVLFENFADEFVRFMTVTYCFSLSILTRVSISFELTDLAFVYCQKN